MRGQAGQQVGEYAILLGVVMTAFLGTQMWVTRSVAGGLVGTSNAVLGPPDLEEAVVNTTSDTKVSEQADALTIATNVRSATDGSNSSGFTLVGGTMPDALFNVDLSGMALPAPSLPASTIKLVLAKDMKEDINGDGIADLWDRPHDSTELTVDDKDGDGLLEVYGGFDTANQADVNGDGIADLWDRPTGADQAEGKFAKLADSGDISGFKIDLDGNGQMEDLVIPYHVIGVMDPKRVGKKMLSEAGIEGDTLKALNTVLDSGGLMLPTRRGASKEEAAAERRARVKAIASAALDPASDLYKEAQYRQPGSPARKPLTEGAGDKSAEEIKSLLQRIADPADPLSGAYFASREIDVGYGAPSGRDAYGRTLSNDDMAYTDTSIEGRTKAGLDGAVDKSRKEIAQAKGKLVEAFGSQQILDTAADLLENNFATNMNTHRSDEATGKELSLDQRIKNSVEEITSPDGALEGMYGEDALKQVLESHGVNVLDSPSSEHQANAITVDEFKAVLQQLATTDDPNTEKNEGELHNAYVTANTRADGPAPKLNVEKRDAQGNVVIKTKDDGSWEMGDQYHGKLITTDLEYETVGTLFGTVDVGPSVPVGIDANEDGDLTDPGDVQFITFDHEPSANSMDVEGMIRVTGEHGAGKPELLLDARSQKGRFDPATNTWDSGYTEKTANNAALVMVPLAVDGNSKPVGWVMMAKGPDQQTGDATSAGGLVPTAFVPDADHNGVFDPDVDGKAFKQNPIRITSKPSEIVPGSASEMQGPHPGGEDIVSQLMFPQNPATPEDAMAAGYAPSWLEQMRDKYHSVVGRIGGSPTSYDADDSHSTSPAGTRPSAAGTRPAPSITKYESSNNFEGKR